MMSVRIAVALGLVLLAPSVARAQAEVDRVLSVVLRSGCAAGMAELGALAARGDLPGEDRAVARRVFELCQKVQADRQSEGGGEVDRSGRGKLVFGGILYGIWAGIAVDILAEVNDGRAVVVPPLLGGAAGLGLALLTTERGEITSAQAWARMTGFDYGTYSGLIWGAAAKQDEKVVVGSALATGLAAGIGATLLTRGLHPLQGDVELVRSGGLWGFATGGLLAGIVQPEDSRITFTMMGVGIDGGLALGLALAQVYDLPRNRVLFMDTGALGGGLVGVAAAILAMGAPEDDNQRRVLAGSALAGMYVGMGAALYLTRNMQLDRHDARAPVPALLTRSLDGHWRRGQLSLLPWITTDSHGPRLTGATTTIVGGAW
jgi:hypothetical protein